MRQKVENRLCPLPDPPLETEAAKPVKLTRRQRRSLEAAEERDRKNQQEWRTITTMLFQNSTAVGRALVRQMPRSADQQQFINEVMQSVHDGSFLIDRLGTELVIDKRLAAVLISFRKQLIEKYGAGPENTMLIDTAVTYYRNFLEVNGWKGNLALQIEHDFFSRPGPTVEYRRRNGGPEALLKGLKVEEMLKRCLPALLEIAESYARELRNALAALERRRSAPSETVERSQPIRCRIVFRPQ